MSLEKFSAIESDFSQIFSECNSCSEFVTCWNQNIIPKLNFISGHYKKPDRLSSISRGPGRHLMTPSRSDSTPSCSNSLTPSRSDTITPSKESITAPQGKRKRSRSEKLPLPGKKKRLMSFSGMEDDSDLDKHILEKHIGKLAIIRVG